MAPMGSINNFHYNAFCSNYSSLGAKVWAHVLFDVRQMFVYVRCARLINFSLSRNLTRTGKLILWFSGLGLVLLKETAPYSNITRINKADYASRYFQQPATETMSNIIDFHNDLMVVLIFISIFIFVLLAVCIMKFATVDYDDFYLGKAPVSRATHNSIVEVIFTVVPSIIIFVIAAPSFALLYSSNDWLEKETELTVSITGHQ